MTDTGYYGWSYCSVLLHRPYLEETACLDVSPRISLLVPGPGTSGTRFHTTGHSVRCCVGYLACGYSLASLQDAIFIQTSYQLSSRGRVPSYCICRLQLCIRSCYSSIGVIALLFLSLFRSCFQPWGHRGWTCSSPPSSCVFSRYRLSVQLSLQPITNLTSPRYSHLLIQGSPSPTRSQMAHATRRLAHSNSTRDGSTFQAHTRRTSSFGLSEPGSPHHSSLSGSMADLDRAQCELEKIPYN